MTCLALTAATATLVLAVLAWLALSGRIKLRNSAENMEDE